jgi:nicotinamide riboside kinase
MVKIIAIEGTHNSGKTETINLIDKILSRNGYKVGIVPEVARIAADKGYGINEDHSPETTKFIILHQLKLEEDMKKGNYDLILCDRTIISAIAYAQYFTPYLVNSSIEILNSIPDLDKRYDRIYLFDRVLFMLKDEYRTNIDPIYQKKIEKFIKDNLHIYNMEYTIIKFHNNPTHRIEPVITELEELLG